MTWFSEDELSRLFGWTPGYVRKLASIHRWRRTGRNPVRYCSDDVLAYRSSTRTPKHLT